MTLYGRAIKVTGTAVCPNCHNYNQASYKKGANFNPDEVEIICWACNTKFNPKAAAPARMSDPEL